MKKKNKKTYFIAAIILFVILLAVGASFLFRQESSMPGTSLISLSQAELTSDNKYLNGKVWIYTFRQGGLGQHAYGTITPSEVAAKTGSDQPTKTLTIDVYYDSQQCVYPIQMANSGTPIYTVRKITWLYNPLTMGIGSSACTSESLALQQINSQGISTDRAYGYFGKKDGLYCFATVWDTNYPIGIFGNTDVRSRMRIDLTIDGKIDSLNLDTAGSIQGNVGSYAYAIWQGNLNTGKSCKYTTDMPFIATYVSQNGPWRIISKSNYQNYVSKLLNTPSGTSMSDVDLWVSSVNNYANTALVAQNFGTLDSATSLDKAVVRDDLTDVLQYPQITMYIKADTLGIYTPTPKAKIISQQSSCFKTGQDGTISFVLQNQGNTYGNWQAWATCENPFDATRRIDISLNAGEQKTYYLALSAAATSRTQKTCTIYVQGTSGTEQATVGVCVDPFQTCQANTKWCGLAGNGASAIYQCDSSGVTQSLYKTCAADEYCDFVNNEPNCIKNGGGGNTCESLPFYNPKRWFCWWEGFSTSMSIIFAVIAGIIGLLIGMRLTKGIGKIENIGIQLLIGVVFAGILAYLAYNYWVAFAIIIVAGVIVYLAIPKV